MDRACATTMHVRLLTDKSLPNLLIKVEKYCEEAEPMVSSRNGTSMSSLSSLEVGRNPVHNLPNLDFTLDMHSLSTGKN